MEKIIIKLESEKSNISFFKPIFVEKNNQIDLANPDDFPNDGKIVMHKEIGVFESGVLYYIDKSDLATDHGYLEKLKKYEENQLVLNPAKYIAYRNKVNKLLLIDVITVYSNKFSLKTHKLTESSNITSEVFFIEDSDCIYGPFKRNYLELSAFNFGSCKDEFEDSEIYLDFLDAYSEYDGEFVLKIKKNEIANFLIDDYEKNLYLTDFKSIVKNKIGEYILFCDDSSLLKWGKDTIVIQKPELKAVINYIDTTLLTNTRSKSDKHKWTRFRELLQSEVEEDKISDVKKILSEKGFLTTEDDSKLKKEFEDLQKRLDGKDKEIIDLKTEIASIKSEQPIKNDYSNLNFENFPKIREAISDLNRLENLLIESNSVDYYKGQASIFKNQFDEENKKLSDLKEKKDTIIAETTNIISGFEETKKNLTSDLAKTKIATDLLNGINIDISQSIEIENDYQSPNIIDVSKSSPEEYIHEIKERLKSQGRDLPFNDVANLTITVQQSFLTILAGAPGVGKTSLADKFSKSLGLSDKFGYLEIPCAKGWSSSKDLIGFYNPLNQKFQASKTKLKNALEASSKFKNAPYIVLLDEANLSPMEHYWSDFIKLADFDYERKIKLSDKETLEFGNGFRFLATINHDHTTEMLSNRLLDRASIIQIEKPTNYDDKQLFLSTAFNEIFDFNTVDTLFKNIHSKWKSEERSSTNKLDDIIKLLESDNSGLIISPRKRNSVINYMRVATGLLKGNDYVALDYAVAQQVLPLVNMRGEKHHESLEKLKKLLQDVGIEKSAALLSRIIERGKEFKHFKYIYY